MPRPSLWHAFGPAIRVLTLRNSIDHPASTGIVGVCHIDQLIPAHCKADVRHRRRPSLGDRVTKMMAPRAARTVPRTVKPLARKIWTP